MCVCVCVGMMDVELKFSFLTNLLLLCAGKETRIVAVFFFLVFHLVDMIFKENYFRFFENFEMFKYKSCLAKSDILRFRSTREIIKKKRRQI